MPVGSQPRDAGPATSHVWPAGGRHLWASGESNALQSHPRGHLVYAASGVLTLHGDGGSWVVPTNRIAWIPARSPHRHRAHGDTDLRIVFLPSSLARLVPAEPTVFVASDLARAVLLALTDPSPSAPRSDDDTAPGHRRRAPARLRRVLVDELHRAPEQPLHLPWPRDDRLQAIARRLLEDPADNSTLTELGTTVGASTRTLSRLFRGELAMTFYEWRAQMRIHHAILLLSDGHTASYTAHACGWANPSSFIATFTEVVGTTPGRYRTRRRTTG